AGARDYFHELHHVGRVEEMETDCALRVGRCAKHGADAQRRGVTSENAVGAYDRLEVCEQLLFDREVFLDSLDYEIARSEIVELFCHGDSTEDLLDLFVATSPLGELALKALRDSPARLRSHAGAHVVEEHFVTLGGRYTPDASAH